MVGGGFSIFLCCHLGYRPQLYYFKHRLRKERKILSLVIIFQMGASVIKKENGVKILVSAWPDGETI